MNEQTTPATPLVSLSTLMTPSKTVSIDFPDMEGFSVDLCYLARDELMKLRSRCLKQKFNKKTRAFEETLDENIFLVEYVKAIIKGWKGLKYKYLKELMLVNVENMSEDDELPFTRENAELLMKNSLDFDTWVTETVGDLENFTKTK